MFKTNEKYGKASIDVTKDDILCRRFLLILQGFEIIINDLLFLILN